jgi:hypothetical protein
MPGAQPMPLWLMLAFEQTFFHANLTPRYRRQVPIPLIDGLTAGRTYEASNLRDHVYGILSIVNNTHVKVDYNKAIYKLFFEVARDEILTSGSLDILFGVQAAG